jgi:hypothetical protein
MANRQGEMGYGRKILLLALLSAAVLLAFPSLAARFDRDKWRLINTFPTQAPMLLTDGYCEYQLPDAEISGWNYVGVTRNYSLQPGGHYHVTAEIYNPFCGLNHSGMIVHQMLADGNIVWEVDAGESSKCGWIPVEFSQQTSKSEVTLVARTVASGRLGMKDDWVKNASIKLSTVHVSGFRTGN